MKTLKIDKDKVQIELTKEEIFGLSGFLDSSLSSILSDEERQHFHPSYFEHIDGIDFSYDKETIVKIEPLNDVFFELVKKLGGQQKKLFQRTDDGRYNPILFKEGELKKIKDTLGT